MSSIRSRGAAVSRRTRSGIRPVYDDFKPASEWKHEDGASVLLYHLPGFVKDQIRIIADSKGTLRVRGERLIDSNKWSRFQEDVVVPEDCKMREIRAKFESGILRITMPKKIAMPFQEESSKTYEPPTPNPQESKPPTSVINPPFLPPLKPETVKPPSGSQNNEHIQPKVSGSQNNEHIQPKVTKQEDGGIPTSLNKENKHEEVGPRVHKKDEEVYTDALHQHNNNNPLSRRVDEDRQMLVNMGVAVLVIVALGAHILYSFAPNQ